MKPLEGVRVLDMTSMLAAPMCARILAEWGADVIKVESLSGDVWRTMYGTATCPCTEEANPCFDAENLNKRYVALDLRSSGGMETLHRMLAQADVFISNYRSSALEAMGLSYEQLKGRYPSLIHASVLGYGSKGPERDRPGYDYTSFYARSGFMADLAPAGGPPVMTIAGLGDHIVATALAGGVAAALYKKAATGLGDQVEVSLLQAGVFVLSTGLLNAFYGKEYPRDRYDPSQATSNTYQCSDGEWFYLAVSDYRKFPELCGVVGRPELAEDPRFHTREAFFRPENKRALTEVFDELFATRPLSFWHKLLDEHDLPHEPACHMKDVPFDPQVTANDYTHIHEYPDGTKTVFANGPVHFGSIDPQALPYEVSGAIGRDTDEVLREFGLTDDELSTLREGGSIR